MFQNGDAHGQAYDARSSSRLIEQAARNSKRGTSRFRRQTVDVE